jgi:Phosphotransferase enzyme family
VFASARYTSDVLPFQHIVNWFGPELSGLRWHRTVGGFSGAEVWCGSDSRGPRYALKAWPPDFPAARLAAIHRWMIRADHLSYVPSVLRAQDGTTSVVDSNRHWDATQWMPGSVLERPKAADVETACAAIAELHATWHDESTALPCPGVTNRLRLLREWLAGHPNPSRFLHLPPELKDLVERAAVTISRAAPAALGALEPWEDVAFRCQPCLRDLRGEHVLFTSGRVTGIVDYGAMAIDHPAVDLARLLGDYAEDGYEMFARGLRAYRGAAGDFDTSDEFPTLLSRTGALGSAINWLRRLESGAEPPVGTADVTRRLSGILRRIEHYAPG